MSTTHNSRSDSNSESFRPLLTILCPIHNETETIPLFYKRITPIIIEIERTHRVNLVFVNNHSTDGSLDLIRGLAERDERVSYLSMSRNVGYQGSLNTALKHVAGDLFVIIDVDCEDPPELIPTFLQHHSLEGYDIVYGVRKDRVEGVILKNIRKVFYWVTRFFSDEDFILYMAEFGLFTREVRDALLLDNNSFPFMRASVGRIGYARLGIPYKRESRIAGETHYNYWRMTKFAVAGILSSSTLMLRMPAYSFPLWLVVWAVLGWNVVREPNPFNAVALFLAGLVYCSYTLMSVSIYLARTYKNGMLRPCGFVDRKNSQLQEGLVLDQSLGKALISSEASAWSSGVGFKKGQEAHASVLGPRGSNEESSRVLSS